MPSPRFDTIVHQLRQMATAQRARGTTDVELLNRYAECDDADAFAVLVERHGALVWRVCQRLLAHEQDAEDAFQATFLILARKAGSIRKAKSLASWLHGVARRTALQARRAAARRQAHEENTSAAVPAAPDWIVAWREVQAVLDEEIQKLPERLRMPFLMCHVEGLGRAEVAERLHVKEGTIWSRLAQARKRLQKRLARRGITLGAILGGAAVQHEAGAAPARALVQATANMVTASSRTGLAEAGISERILTLVEGGLSSMKMIVAKWSVIVVFAAGIIAAGVGAWGQSTAPDPTRPRRQFTDPNTTAPVQPRVPSADLENRVRKLETEVANLRRELRALRSKRWPAVDPRPAPKPSINESKISRNDTTAPAGGVNQVTPQKIQVFRLKHVDAVEVANLLEKLLGTGGNFGRQPTIVPDPRTNTLLIRGSTTQFRQVDELLRVLDAPKRRGSGTGGPAR